MFSFFSSRLSAQPQEAGASSQPLLTRAKNLVTRFADSERGNIAMITGFMVIPLVGVSLASFEFSNAYGLRSNSQSAVDAAAVAVARSIDKGMSHADAIELGKKVFASNFNQKYSGDTTGRYQIEPVEIRVEQNGSIFASHQAKVLNSAMSLVGMGHLDVAVSSTVVAAQREVEIVMVLDNSGSMRNDMDDLRLASCNMVRIIYGQEPGDTESAACSTFSANENGLRIRMALVPFSASVNIGPQHRGASFMDMNGDSSIHKENFSYPGFSVSSSYASEGNSPNYSSSADLANGVATQNLSPVDGVSGSARAQLEYSREFPTTNRWALFDSLNTNWGGCVEVRPGVHGVTDTEPDPNNPDTLFVPMFAPDEPDWVSTDSSDRKAVQSYGRNGKSYDNDYIKDRPNSCPQPVAAVEGQDEVVETRCVRRETRSQCKARTGKGNRYCKKSKNRLCLETEDEVVQEAVEPVPAVDAWLSTAKAQARTCKYSNAKDHNNNSVSGSSFNSWWGPNFYCTTTPITPLTNNVQELIDDIKDMQATGWTNITSGLMWGWRVLSPGAPFTESRLDAADAAAVQQIIILLTDGRNEMRGQDNHNHSNYFAWGYGAKGRLDGTATTNDALNSAMNTRLATACNNIPNNIWVFTVGYRLNDATTQGLLNNCGAAAANDRAFTAGDGDLNDTFKQIAEQISDLRISK